MRVRLLQGRAGPTVSQNPGDVVDVDPAEAMRMIERGQAEPVRKDEPEQAVRKTKREKAIR